MLVVELLTELTDVLGLTGTVSSATNSRLYRAINRGKDRVVSAHKWDWLETSTQQLFTSGTRAYSLTTAAERIVSIEGSDGTPVRRIDRDTYDEMHRPSTSTASLPSVYTPQGRSTAGAIAIHVWPSPSANSTGTLRYIATVPDTTGSVGWHFVPQSHYAAILAAAEVEYYRQQAMRDATAIAEAKYQDEIGRLVPRAMGPVVKDGTEL